MKELFKIYKRLLELHIGTKTNDLVFHQASEKFYETMFDVFHTVSEKRQDIEEDTPEDCKEARKEAYDLLEKAKEELKSMIAEETSIGMDNLLRWLYDKLESDCWTARGLVTEEEEVIEDTPQLSPSMKFKMIPWGY